jgi:alkylation response protein AidB-like acyl-CoA dehydrogenase
MTRQDFDRQSRADALASVCDALATSAFEVESAGRWPADGIDRLASAGLLSWFIPKECGGQGVGEVVLLETLVSLSTACLNTTFALTQILGAARRIAASHRLDLRDRFLPSILDGTSLATLGISHLTTSGQHLAKPMLEASLEGDGVQLQGRIPWVTGAAHCPWIVAGAVDAQRRPMMFLLSTESDGVEIDPSPRLVALNASRTSCVRCTDVKVPASQMLFAPAEEGAFGAQLGRTGGLQTSALALGLAVRALEFLQNECQKRSELSASVGALEERTIKVRARLNRASETGCVDERSALRVDANFAALDATQAALAVAKGAGYVHNHRVAQWCQQALFFLVWSCPTTVLRNQVATFAGGRCD